MSLANDKEHIHALFYRRTYDTRYGAHDELLQLCLLESNSDTMVLGSPPFATLGSNSVFERRDDVNSFIPFGEQTLPAIICLIAYLMPCVPK
jgi:hypothetical protein